MNWPCRLNGLAAPKHHPIQITEKRAIRLLSIGTILIRIGASACAAFFIIIIIIVLFFIGASPPCAADFRFLIARVRLILILVLPLWEGRRREEGGNAAL
jgi:hypothetical protein